MFTLSTILLTDSENLFQDFWSRFSISFIKFYMSGFILKKVTELTGPETPAHPARNPSRRRPRRSTPPPPRRRLTAGAARRRLNLAATATDLAEGISRRRSRSVFFGLVN